ncbi:hypothetical protein Q4566_16875 [Tamlana sp. 2_MG-2023]|uniref:MauE/DoxX family redox-associated membrane protein n=1 Tax=unclassified Tamlana TaxID=2614803 RepID=UPI0026E2EEF1|nr:MULTISPECIES: MauE/DoxX family redox-associated membrane protein [unclassified Tamlana]MDO6761883.1 hypothetical protein [Tamlana sp. 2_MG-2023]MDO6792645.1 hypothetical protein [Tamlana sp. 1_MG-2023]
MTRRRSYPIFLKEIICFLFIFLFSYAAISKLLDYSLFKIQLGQSPLLTAFAGWVAWVIPSIELITVIMLVIPKLKLVALYGCLSLMSLFTWYIFAILNFSEYVPCSCGGILDKLGWQEHLVLNISFIILAIIGILIPAPTLKHIHYI